MKKRDRSEFEKAASAYSRGSFVGELWVFMKNNKKWWLLPIIITFLILTTLVFFSSTGLAPFIYTLF